MELQKYLYRQIFHLTYQELLDEPADEFFTNLKIYSYIKEKEAKEMDRG